MFLPTMPKLQSIHSGMKKTFRPTTQSREPYDRVSNVNQYIISFSNYHLYVYSTGSTSTITAFSRVMTCLKEIRNGQQQTNSRLSRIESIHVSTTAPQQGSFDIPLPLKKIEQFDLLEEALKNPESQTKFVSVLSYIWYLFAGVTELFFLRLQSSRTLEGKQ